MKVVVLTIPKSGTYLMAQLLSEFGLRNTHRHFHVNAVSDYSNANRDEARQYPDRFRVYQPLSKSIQELRNNEFAVGHLPARASKQLRQARVVFVYRNLRDVLTSSCRWIALSGRWQTVNDSWRKMPEGPDMLFAFLQIHGMRAVKDIVRSAAWYHEPCALRVRFEQLFGDYGSESRLLTLRRLSEHLSLRLTDDEMLARLSAAMSAETLTKSSRRSRHHDFWDNRVEDFFVASGLQKLNVKLGYERHVVPRNPFNQLRFARPLSDVVSWLEKRRSA